MKTILKKFDNNWYWKSYNTSSKIKRVLWFVAGSIFLNSYLPVPMYFKTWLLKLFGAKLGNQITLKPKINIKFPWLLEIGDYSWIGEGVWIDNLAKVVIGSNVCISQGAMVLTGNHDYSKESFDLIISEITLADGVWIGAKSIICQGVTCESHSVLTVGSVATKNLDAYGIYKGNPAEKIKIRIIKP